MVLVYVSCPQMFLPTSSVVVCCFLINLSLSSIREIKTFILDMENTWERQDFPVATQLTIISHHIQTSVMIYSRLETIDRDESSAVSRLFSSIKLMTASGKLHVVLGEKKKFWVLYWPSLWVFPRSISTISEETGHYSFFGHRFFHANWNNILQHKSVHKHIKHSIQKLSNSQMNFWKPAYKNKPTFLFTYISVAVLLWMHVCNLTFLHSKQKRLGSLAVLLFFL